MKTRLLMLNTPAGPQPLLALDVFESFLAGRARLTVSGMALIDGAPKRVSATLGEGPFEAREPLPAELLELAAPAKPKPKKATKKTRANPKAEATE